MAAAKCLGCKTCREEAGKMCESERKAGIALLKYAIVFVVVIIALAVVVISVI